MVSLSPVALCEDISVWMSATELAEAGGWVHPGTGFTVIRKWNRTECAVLNWLKNTTQRGGIHTHTHTEGKKKKHQSATVVDEGRETRTLIERAHCPENRTKEHNALCLCSRYLCYVHVSNLLSIPFIPELLPSVARVLYLVCQRKNQPYFLNSDKTLTFVAHYLQSFNSFSSFSIISSICRIAN